MTYAELKAEADRLGYRLCKKPKKIELLDCTCGHAMSDIVDFSINAYGKFYRCKCGKRSGKYAKSEKQARENWNEYIRKERRQS